ncbi:MAG: MetQ/NlpA family ABC transporter substrate-binding protein [Clostridia bacterium]|nr:MetQ/NlpA family ABC transporter substrate-binding protein [Clostridia bacterium]
MEENIMKKVLALVLALVLVAAVFAGCSKPAEEPADTSAPADTTAPADLPVIKVGASVTPHAEILNAIREELNTLGYDLEVVEFTDYIIPNTALEGGDLDANYFQHQPYLDSFNVENSTHLVSIAAIHYEPFGIYAGKCKSLDELADGAEILVPNDTTNEARALLLLEAQGLIKLKEGVGLEATILDIVENPKNLKITELEAAQLSHSLPDVDMAVINGNYAIQAGLSVATDAVAIEDKDSVGAATFANVLVVREGDEEREDLKALAQALTSEAARAFMEATYNGGVVPTF